MTGLAPIRWTVDTITSDALDQLYAERDRIDAVLTEVLGEFTGMRNSDNAGPVQYWQAPRILPEVYQRWRDQAEGIAPVP